MNKMTPDRPLVLTEETQLRSQKMEGLGQLALGVAHDLKDMLIIINGYCDLLLHDETASRGQVEFLKEIYVAGEQAAKLTNQLLLINCERSVVPQPVDLADVVLKTAKLLRSLVGEKIVLQVESFGILPMVRADPGMIKQVLLNLALNSRQAMPKGGQLTVTTESRTIDEVLAGRLPGGRAGEFVCLTVKDSGEGISPHVMSRLLAPFSSQEGGEGAGLGLAAVRGIVQRHDGWIQVESEPSVGTTFRIFLPVSVEDSAVTLLPSPEAQVARGKETILLVEDEAQVRGLAVVVLQKQGYRVLEATKAEEALDVWKRHASRIDLLFTDLVMTGEITGQELAEQLQAEKPSLKVIYTSGYSVEKGAEIFALKAETPFVQKPYSPKKLAETVRQTLDGSKKTPA